LKHRQTKAIALTEVKGLLTIIKGNGKSALPVQTAQVNATRGFVFPSVALFFY